jgi:phosphoserine phosphatase
MVGDGATDMEARLHADAFIGFGGIVEREKVKNGADLFIRDWTELPSGLGREKTLKLWQTAEAVCFDVDSTVIQDEGIDVLADHNGKLEAVREWTKRAMGGEIPFQDALKERLEIIKPSAQNVTDVLAAHPLQLTDGFKEMLADVRARGAEVYLVSGGFRQMINPIADMLNIPRDHIFANNLLFEADGSFKGYDHNEPTSRKGGKAVVVKELVDKHKYSPIIMVGDGATDMEARLHADAFIGFGGIVEREKVKNGADLFIRDWTELQ